MAPLLTTLLSLSATAWCAPVHVVVTASARPPRNVRRPTSRTAHRVHLAWGSGGGHPSDEAAACDLLYIHVGL